MDIIQKIKEQYYSQDGADLIIITLTKQDYNELLKVPLRALQEVDPKGDKDVQFVVL